MQEFTTIISVWIAVMLTWIAVTLSKIGIDINYIDRQDTLRLTTDEAADSIQTEPCKHIWVWSKSDKLKFKFCYKCGVRFS